jgi:hypothetical protein
MGWYQMKMEDQMIEYEMVAGWCMAALADVCVCFGEVQIVVCVSGKVQIACVLGKVRRLPRERGLA